MKKQRQALPWLRRSVGAAETFGRRPVSQQNARHGVAVLSVSPLGPAQSLPRFRDCQGIRAFLYQSLENSNLLRHFSKRTIVRRPHGGNTLFLRHPCIRSHTVTDARIRDLFDQDANLPSEKGCLPNHCAIVQQNGQP
jgi:hypothetical protein